MLYFKVKPSCDNRTRYTWIGSSNLKFKENGILVGNELYTARERERIANSSVFFGPVNVPKNTIYFFFGVRFSTVTGGYIHYNENGEQIY